MGTNDWYFPENVSNGSSYTDFTGSSYTDLTKVSNSNLSRRRPVKKASGKRAAVKRKKKRTALKVFFCISGIAAVILAAFLMKDVVVEACSAIIDSDYFSDIEKEDHAARHAKKHNEEKEEAFQITADRVSYDKTDPAYGVAEEIMAPLWRDNDIDTAWEIVNWVHSNIFYQTVTDSLSFEEAAFRGFTQRSGDCYVYFACTKMLLDCAGIPNLMVERYPVITNGHYWNLVQLDGEWYHCDATVFMDHPGMYFMCTDDEIADEHHSFDESLYPERAQGYSDYWNTYGDYDVYDDYEAYGDYGMYDYYDNGSAYGDYGYYGPYGIYDEEDYYGPYDEYVEYDQYGPYGEYGEYDPYDGYGPYIEYDGYGSGVIQPGEANP